MRGIVFAALALLALAACDKPTEHAYSVRVAGDKGTPFSGTCQVMRIGSTASMDAAGKVPASFDATGTGISCAIQTHGGGIRVVITRDGGKDVASGFTMQQYGVVALAGQ
jgi:hypothetical protein